jgi:uncharacterized membrane protein
MTTRKATPERLVAFSDGVLAIIVTIMVLELKVPHGASPRAFLELWPTFFAIIAGISALYFAPNALGLK